MEGHLVQTDTGEYLWFNSRTGLYEFIRTEVSAAAVNEVIPESMDKNNAETGDTSFNDETAYETLKDNDNNLNLVERKNIWDSKQTLLLIDICGHNKDRLNNPKYRKTEVYKEISDQMKKNGHFFSSEQCLNKMKTLTTKYKEIRDFNATSGNNPKKWAYFDILTEYFGDRPGIVARASCSSLNIARNNLPDHSSPSTSNVQKRKSESCESEEKGKMVKKTQERQNPKKEMVAWLKDYKKEVQEREERRLSMAEQQHNENKEMLSQILDLLKNKSSYVDAPAPE
ncbi:unnamed protein product [Phaedon cochleariae]|uniref:Myb/SANT-like DNA-binding domain-containing protein n=1 Tax=Phaedon cochleariae TaxID=80249 RepID=A0A9P0DHQ0_PHACE|nr:unnamed protein product [Phaedon cochleariae]